MHSHALQISEWIGYVYFPFAHANESYASSFNRSVNKLEPRSRPRNIILFQSSFRERNYPIPSALAKI